MHPRNGIRILARLAALAAAASLGACAVAPPTRTETASIRKIREEYFRSYPESHHVAEINRGQVVKGMTLFEVLASWGIPDGRVVRADHNGERWIYVVVDDRSLDWVRYEFDFEANRLVDWAQTPHTTNAAALYAPDAVGPVPALPAWASTTPGSGAPRR